MGSEEFPRHLFLVLACLNAIQHQCEAFPLVLSNKEEGMRPKKGCVDPSLGVHRDKGWGLED
jgi:hypothetical protein